MSFEYIFKPLGDWFPRSRTLHYLRQKSNFGKTWSDVLTLLERELRFLKYRTGSVVLMTAHSEYDVTRKGQLRADVRKPAHPGVVLKFDAYDGFQKKYVQLSFECDQFTEWKANVRAIADALESLRRIDRYGVTGGGRHNAHYEGYKSLPPGETDLNEQASEVRTACETIRRFSGESVHWTFIRDDKGVFEMMYRRARAAAHPDKASQGGSHESFIGVEKAGETLKKWFGI